MWRSCACITTHCSKKVMRSSISLVNRFEISSCIPSPTHKSRHLNWLFWLLTMLIPQWCAGDIDRGESKVQEWAVLCHAPVLLAAAWGHYPPSPPPLPAFRVQEAPAFTYTGVDFARPLYVRGSTHSNPKGGITCCVVRAIHLKLVPDLTTQSFISASNSLQRYCLADFIIPSKIPSNLVLSLSGKGGSGSIFWNSNSHIGKWSIHWKGASMVTYQMVI